MAFGCVLAGAEGIQDPKCQTGIMKRSRLRPNNNGVLDFGDDFFDFSQPVSDTSSAPDKSRRSDAVPASVDLPLIRVASSEVYEGFRKVISNPNTFGRVADSNWPVAGYGVSDGDARVELRPQRDEPLLAEELDQIAQRMFEQSKTLSDIEADVCDILMSRWLRDAKDPDHRAFIQVDDLCRERGLRPKLGGQGHRGGYSPGQRLAHLKAAQTIFDSWITLIFRRRAGDRHLPTKGVLESRPFIVTDRAGSHRFSWRDPSCHHDCIDVTSFKYVVGEVFGAYLLANRQETLLSPKALRYSAKTETWEKRLARYFSHLWRCRAHNGQFSNPIKVSTVLTEGLRLTLESRRLASTRERFGKAIRTLKRDEVISEWRWGRQEEKWPEWTIIVEPPAEIRRQYSHLARLQVLKRGCCDSGFVRVVRKRHARI